MKTLLIIITLIIGANVYAQFDATIKFKDGTVITDKIENQYNRKAFRSKTTRNKYKYKDISEMLVNINNKLRRLFFLDIKKSVRYSASLSSGIGIKVYQNKRVELFHMVFGPKAFRYMIKMSTKFNPGYEVFIRRKGEEPVYSIGGIDGHGNYKLMERLTNFFSDCPELVKMIEDGTIDKLDTIKICDYYNKLCGTDQ